MAPASHNPRDGDGAAPGRVGYLESLRGLACAQVLLLHALSAFAPRLTRFSTGTWGLADYVHASPLYFLYDGYAAVYLFFVLSGYVLAGAFARQVDHPVRAFAARTLRLGVPALAALFLAAGVYSAFGGLNAAAGASLHSAFLGGGWTPTLSLGAILREGFVNALFVGYRGVGPYFSAPDWLAMGLDQSYDLPLWSLSYELYGSVLVFALCWLRARDPRVAGVAAALLALHFSRSPFLLFVLGFGLRAFGLGARPLLRPAVAALAIAFGVGLCCAAEAFGAPLASGYCALDSFLLGPCRSPAALQKIFAAPLLFVGVVESPTMRRWLRAPALGALGRMSFPLYLVHCPIIFGLGSFAALALSPLLGWTTPYATLALVVAGSVGMAALFAPLDALALQAARRVNATTRRRANFSAAPEFELT